MGEESNHNDSTILDKIMFGAFLFASSILASAEWVFVGFGLVGKVLGHIGGELKKKWKKRPAIKNARLIIDSLIVEYNLTPLQAKILGDLIQQHKNKGFIQQILGPESLETVCSNWLLSRNFGSKQLVESVVGKFVSGIIVLVSREMSPTQLYRLVLHMASNLNDAMTILGQAQTTLRNWEFYLSKRALISLFAPSIFVPLDKKLECDKMIRSYNEHLFGMRTDLPEGKMFRRPHISGIDIDEGYVYECEDVIDEIEDNFNETNIHLVVGDSGSGKTTLSFVLGYKRIWHPRGLRNLVYYVDMRECTFATLKEGQVRIIEEISNLLQSIEIAKEDLGISGLLLIIDNVHHNLQLARHIYDVCRAKKNGLDTNPFVEVDILMLARCLGDDLTGYSERLIQQITGASDSIMEDEYLKTSILGTQERDLTISGLVDIFLENNYIKCTQNDRDELVSSVSYVSKGVLWLVAFALESLFEKLTETGSSLAELVEEMDICDRLRGYYLEDIFSDICGNSQYQSSAVNLSGRADELEAYTSLLLTLALFNQLEISVIESFLHASVRTRESTPSQLRAFINTVKSILLERGEIIVKETEKEFEDTSPLFKDRHLSLPHVSLASEMVECFSAWRSIPSFAEDEETIQTLDQKISTYIQFCVQKKADVSEVIRGTLLFFGGTNLAYETISYILDSPDFISEIAERGLLYDFFKQSVEIDLVRSTGILAQLLTSTSEPEKIIELTGDILALYGRPEVRSVLRERVQDSERPWEIIESLIKMNLITTDEDIFQILLERTDYIAEYIEESETPWTVLSSLRKIPDILRDETIRGAVQSTIHAFVKALDEEQYPNELLDGFRVILSLTDDEFLHHALAKAILAKDFDKYLLSLIQQNPFLLESEIIIRAILKSLKSTHEPWRVLKIISEKEGVIRHEMLTLIEEEVINQIASEIETSSNPEGILIAISGIQSLVENPRIQTAIASRAIDLVSWLLESHILSQTLMDLLNIPWIFENSYIQNAISKLIRDTESPWIILGKLSYVNPRILEMSEVKHSMLQRIDDICTAIECASAPWEIIQQIENIEVIIENSRVVAAIVNAIQSDRDSIRTIESLMFDLSEQTQIHSAIAQRIRTSKEPWKFISHLILPLNSDEIPEIMEVIVEVVSEQETLLPVLSALSDWPNLHQNPDVEAALLARINEIVRIIETSSEPWNVAQIVSSIRVLNENELVNSALKRRCADIARAIRKKSAIPRILLAVFSSTILMEDTQIQDAIEQSFDSILDAPDFLEEILMRHDSREIEFLVKIIGEMIRRSSTPWRVIESIRYHSRILENEAIIEAISFVIEQNSNLGRILEAFSKILLVPDNDAIQNAIQSRFHEIAQAILDSPRPQDIIDGLEDIPGVLENEDILISIERVILESRTPLEIIDDIELIPGLVCKERIWNAIIARKKDILALLESSSSPEDVLLDIPKGSPLIYDTELREGLAHKITKAELLAPLISEISNKPTLTRVEGIEYALMGRIGEIVNEIMSAEEPCEILEKIKYFPTLPESPRLRGSLHHLTDKIENGIMRSDMWDTLLERIKGFSEITTQPDVQKAIEKRLTKKNLHYGDISRILEDVDLRTDRLVEKLVKSIKSDKRYLDILDIGVRIPVIFKLDRIRELVIDSKDIWSDYDTIVRRIGGIPDLAQTEIFIVKTLRELGQRVDLCGFIETLCDHTVIVNDERVVSAIHERIEEIGQSIQNSISPLRKIYQISRIDGLLQHPVIISSIEQAKKNIVEELEDDDEIASYMSGLQLCPALIEDPEILRALAEMIGKSENPSRLSCYILHEPAFSTNPLLLSAIDARILDIALEILTKEDPFAVLRFIARTDYLKENSTIRRAIFTRRKEMSRMIGTSNEPWRIVRETSDLLLIEGVLETLNNTSGFVARSILTQWEPEEILTYIPNSPYLLVDDKVQESIVMVAPRVARRIIDSSSPYEIIEMISNLPKLMNEIRHAINEDHCIDLCEGHVAWLETDIAVQFYEQMKPYLTDENRRRFIDILDVRYGLSGESHT